MYVLTRILFLKLLNIYKNFDIKLVPSELKESDTFVVCCERIIAFQNVKLFFLEKQKVTERYKIFSS